MGKYEYMPDKSWKATGICTNTYKGGDKRYETWEEGSHLKEYTFKTTGGTGKYEGASGGGTYMYEGLTDTRASWYCPKARGSECAIEGRSRARRKRQYLSDET